MGLARRESPNIAGDSDDYSPSSLSCEFSQVIPVQGRWWGWARFYLLPTPPPGVVNTASAPPPAPKPSWEQKLRMWPIWVFRLFLVTVTQTQSISPPTKMQLVSGACSGAAPDGEREGAVVQCPGSVSGPPGLWERLW